MEWRFELSLTLVLALNLYQRVGKPTGARQVCILNKKKQFLYPQRNTLKKKIPGPLSMFLSMKIIFFSFMSVIKKKKKSMDSLSCY